MSTSARRRPARIGHCLLALGTGGALVLAVCVVSSALLAEQEAPGRARVVTAAPDESPPAAAPDGEPVIVRDPEVVIEYAVAQAHANCFVDDPFPSATKCRECHPQHFREWSVSPHAYAQLSPVFNAMSSKLIEVTNGTQGDFCIRCHTPVGMALGEPIAISNMDRPPSSREGVTCVVCHRINQPFGKISARHALVPGDQFQPVYGPLGSAILFDVLANPDKFGVLKTSADPTVRGRDIHRESIPFFQITTSGFCGSCHDVFAPNGFRLEDAFSEFKQSPAIRECGTSCQDCHMGAFPGEARGYTFGPAAVIGNAKTPPRKHTNHTMVGPDYSIIHPGLYPHNPEAVREEHEPRGPLTVGLATMREWLLFDDAAGWGTEEFEKTVTEDQTFPAPWDDADLRRRGREILNDQHQLLAEATRDRLRLLQVGYRLGEPEVLRADRKGIKFRVPVYNGTNGHGVPTGFDAERIVFVRTMVWDRNGTLVYQSGDLDPNGDLRDLHSMYVHNGALPLDRDLLSLQTRFVIRLQRGGEREQVLTFPFSATPLPFVRPETRPFTVLGRPLGLRKHKQNLEVGGHRYGVYTVGPEQLTGCGPYCVQVQLIAGMVPVNLVGAISSVGFDYHMSPAEVARNVVAGHLVLHEHRFSIDAP